jgi:hypothetical protein
MTLYPPEIFDDLRGYCLFMDTGAFNAAARSESFARLLLKLRRNADCTFSTVPLVRFEFTRGSSTLEVYNKRVTMLKDLVDYIDPMRFLDSIPDFDVVMAKINDQNKSQTDFMLAACLYNYGHSKTALITGDFKAYPSFIPRSHVITIEQDKSKAITNLGVYQFDRAGYAQAAQRALGP